MTQTGPTGVLRAIAVIGVVAVLVAACSSGTSGGLFPSVGESSPPATQPLPVESEAAESSAPADVTQAPAPEEPVATEAVEPSEASAPESPAGSPAAIGDAALNLENLTSYRLKVQLEGSAATSLPGEEASAAPGETPTPSQLIVMEATMVLKPEKAMRFTISGVGGGETGSAELSYIVIGDKLWMTVGGEAIELPGGTAGQMMNMFDSLGPEKIFASAYGSVGSGLLQVGTETKNGVPTVHYRADTAVLQQMATSLGGSNVADWSAEVWIATDGGYLVSAVQKGKVTSGDNEGDYLVSIDVTDINDPANKVEAPT